MPTLTRWFIKTSFIYLALALLVGLILALQPVLPLGAIGGMYPVYIHLLVLGWLTQLIFGVAFWMFPKYSIEKPRRSETVGWWTYASLNAGLLLRAIAEPLNSTIPGFFSAWALVASALFQFAAVLMFVINSWGRVKER